MISKPAVLFLLVGCVLASKGKHRHHGKPETQDPENDYAHRLQVAFQDLGGCVILTSMIDTNETSNADLGDLCVNGSPLQALLPALHAELSIQPSECIEKVWNELTQYEEWPKLEKKLNKIMSQKVNEKTFCHFVDKVYAPLSCAFQDICPSKQDKQAFDASLAAIYSVQQFFHNGVQTDFHCKDTNITINPQLYKFGTKYNAQMKYLTNELDCKKYEPSTPSTTEKPTTTTTESFTWSSEDEWSSESIESEEEETTVKPPKSQTARVKLTRRNRHQQHKF